jgi:hypothetical protein
LCRRQARSYQAFDGIVHIIIMPPQFIIIGMPAPIMVIMVWQHCMKVSFMVSSIGPISQVIIPLGAIVQVILHIIIGIAMPGIPFIIPIIGMPAIIGFIIIGFMPPIIGIMGIGIIVCIAVFMAGSPLRETNKLRLSRIGVGAFEVPLNNERNALFAFLQQVARDDNRADALAVIVD